MRNTHCARPSHLFGGLARTLGLIICKIHLVIIWSNKHCTLLKQCSVGCTPQLGGTWLAHRIHKTHENTQNTQYHRAHITWEVHGWPHLAADPAPVKPQLFRPTHSHFSMTIQIQIKTHSWKREVKSPKKNSLCFLLLAWPWIFLSNQIDLDNSGWNSSQYRNVSFLVV